MQGYPPGCPNGSSTFPGTTPTSLTCPAPPGSANGGMFFDIINTGSNPVQIKSFSFLTPPAYTAGTSFPLSIYYRRLNAQQCLPGLVCTGSYRDNSFTTAGAFISAPVSAPASNLSDASWVNAWNGSLVTLNTLEALQGSFNIALAPSETVGFWFLFTDGTRPTRAADATLPDLTKAVTGDLWTVHSWLQVT